VIWSPTPLRKVGLAPVDQYLNKYPGDLSAGRSSGRCSPAPFLLGPDLLIADERCRCSTCSAGAKILELMLSFDTSST